MELSQRIGQQLRLTPQLRQAIKFMGLSALELETEVNQLLEENPILEKIEFPRHRIDYSLDSMPEEPPSLHDYLYWQLNLADIADEDMLIACSIIDAIDDDGYLSVDVNKLLNHVEHADVKRLESILQKIQQFDPPGVGCRNLQECLAIQNSDPICAKVINECMALLSKRDHKQIQKKLKLSPQETEAAIRKILQLNPKPGSMLYPTNKQDYVIPDVLVTTSKQNLHVHLNPEIAINLRINYEYGNHMQQQLRDAQWLIHSLKTRNRNILAVASWIVHYQQDFFKQGSTHMRPLKMQQLADEINLSESTISRICSNKYMHTPRGTYKLKYFFNSELSNGCSSTAIKAIIEDLIKNETPSKPLSDASICLKLTKQHIKIARRTVAKYRESMGILPAHRRKTGSN